MDAIIGLAQSSDRLRTSHFDATGIIGGQVPLQEYCHSACVVEPEVPYVGRSQLEPLFELQLRSAENHSKRSGPGFCEGDTAAQLITTGMKQLQEEQTK